MPNTVVQPARRVKTRRPASKKSKAKPARGALTAMKSARLEARINPELQAMIKQAAELEGRKVSEFVSSALQTAARQAISSAQVFQLSLSDQQMFADALLNPPAATPALRRAFARRRDLLAET